MIIYSAMQGKNVRLATASSHGHQQLLAVVRHALPSQTTTALLADRGRQLAISSTRAVMIATRHRRRISAQWARDGPQQAPEFTQPVQSCSPNGSSDSQAAAAAASTSSKVNDETMETAASSSASRWAGLDAALRIKEQQCLLRQLVGTGSMSSLSSLDATEPDIVPASGQEEHHCGKTSVRRISSTALQKQPEPNVANTSSSKGPPAGALSKNRSQPGGLYDDDSAADYDPIMLDLLGFTSVAQYLQYKLDTAVKQAKVDSAGVGIWGSLAFGVLTQMGGHDMYMHHIRQLTSNGNASDNLMFLWVYILGYFTVKSCFMSLATGWRAFTDRRAEQHKVQELEKLEKQHQRLAFWQLQERLDRLDNRANRTFAEFALASLLLGLLIFMKGGLDDLVLQMETMDEQALSGLLVMMWLFWETYFAGIGAVVQLVTVATHFVEKWQHKQKWERKRDASE